MEIIFQGTQTTDEATENLISILNLFKERYGIENFRNIKLALSLMDTQGDSVELIDPVTSEAFATLEVYKSRKLFDNKHGKKHLKLIVDNTDNHTDS